MARLIEWETNARCAEFEALLTDAVDGVLAAEDEARFAEHVKTCARCDEMLDEAKRGAVWLELLKSPRPEPAAELLERILAKTSGAVGGYGLAPAIALPVPPVAPSAAMGGVLLPFRARVSASPQWQSARRNLFQPRLAMTAAMAFFSIALTLNLTGVRLNELRASDLGPAGLRRAAYDTTARAARYYGNLKVVYVLESRLEDLRKSREDEGDGDPERSQPRSDVPKAQPDKARKRRAPGQGASRVEHGPRLVQVAWSGAEAGVGGVR